MCAICNGMTERQVRRAMAGHINKYGWAIQVVEPEESCGRFFAGFSYTVGLTAIGREELVITGRPPWEAAVVLNALAQRAKEVGPFAAGERISVGGLELCMSPAPECAQWLLAATDFYGVRKVRATQAVWADSEGRLPWERAVASPIFQPLLGPPLGGGNAA